MSNDLQQGSCDPTERTIHKEPHDDHWGTWEDRIYICGSEPKKGIGISDGCVCHVMAIKRWLELAEENAKLLREREGLQKRLEDSEFLREGQFDLINELIGALEEISKLPWEDQGAHVDLAGDVLARVKGEK